MTLIAVSNRIEFAVRLTIAVDGQPQQVDLAAGEGKTILLETCPDTVALSEIIVDPDGAATPTSFTDEAGSQLHRDQQYACGNLIKMEIASDTLTVTTEAK